MKFIMPSTIICIFIATMFIITLNTTNAKPPHFPTAEENQINYNNNNEVGYFPNNLIDTGLKPWQLELLAQRMAEMNQLNQLNNFNGPDYGTLFDRALRSGTEIKRQSRYRLCYFNPVSCFRK